MQNSGVTVHVQFSVVRTGHGSGSVTQDEVGEPSNIRSPRSSLLNSKLNLEKMAF
jgi:hypothetical protein